MSPPCRELLMLLKTDMASAGLEPKLIDNRIEVLVPTSGGKTIATVFCYSTGKLSVQLAVTRWPTWFPPEEELTFRRKLDAYRMGLFGTYLGPADDVLVYGKDLGVDGDEEIYRLHIASCLEGLAKDLASIRAKIKDIWPGDA